MPFYFFSFVQKYTTTCVRRSKVKPTCEFLWTLISDDLKCATFLMETTIFDLKPDSLQTLICTFLCLAPQMTSHTKLIHSYWTTMPILILLSFLCFCLLIAMHWHPFLIFAFYNISGMTLKIISNPSHLLSFLCFCLLTAMHWHPFFLFFFAFHNIYGMTLKIIHTQYLACSNWYKYLWTSKVGHSCEGGSGTACISLQAVAWLF